MSDDSCDHGIRLVEACNACGRARAGYLEPRHAEMTWDLRALHDQICRVTWDNRACAEMDCDYAEALRGAFRAGEVAMRERAVARLERGLGYPATSASNVVRALQIEEP